MKTHQKRLIAGSIALIAFIISLVHHTLFFFFVLLVSYILYREYFKMFQKYIISPAIGIVSFGMNTILLTFLYLLITVPVKPGAIRLFNIYTLETYSLLIPVLIYLVLIVLALFHVIQYDKSTFTKSFAISLLGFIYMTIPLLCTLYLFLGVTRTLFLVPFFIVWINDSAAYYLGSKWGKKKITPLISPNKTYLGTFGSVACTVMIFLLVKTFWPAFPLEYFHVILFIPVLCLLAHLGDFTESAMKRMLDIKDSGNLLPGHGGILDRVDSLLFVLCVYILLIPMFQ